MSKKTDKAFEEFWSIANQHISQKHRVAVNHWHSSLYLAIDNLFHELLHLEGAEESPRFRRAFDEFKKLRQCLEGLPYLLK